MKKIENRKLKLKLKLKLKIRKYTKKRLG